MKALWWSLKKNLKFNFNFRVSSFNFQPFTFDTLSSCLFLPLVFTRDSASASILVAMQGERARSYLVLDSGLLIQPDKKSSKKPNIFESREYQDPFWHRCHSLGVLAEAGAGAGGPPHMVGGYAEPWSEIWQALVPWTKCWARTTAT